MFEKDENKPRRFWPWGRKDEQTADAEAPDDSAAKQATDTIDAQPEAEQIAKDSAGDNAGESPGESVPAPAEQEPAPRRFWPWGKKETEQTKTVEEAEQPQETTEPADKTATQLQVPVADDVKADSTSADEVTDKKTEQPVSLAAEHSETKGSETKDSGTNAPVTESPTAIEKPAPQIEAASSVIADTPVVKPVVTKPETDVASEQAQPPETVEESKVSNFFGRMKQGLTKTRSALVEGVATLMLGKKEIDDELLEDLETQLLTSDVGIEATSEIINELTRRITRNELDDADALITALKDELAHILEPANKPLVIPESKTPFVMLIVGVNGVGKTTTIGKLARRLQGEGKKVMLAAGDTFRAAAVEQLQVWGERNDIPVVAQHTGADSASVIYDAFEAAKARQIDVLIADTAGRLHNKDNLMEELKKVKRVLGKIDPEAPHEVLLVLDAGTGQNALSQAKLFNETVQLTGLALTKLDGTAKGGVIFALSKQMQTPIRFLGVGEQIEDLRPFDANEFVEALFDTSKS